MKKILLSVVLLSSMAVDVHAVTYAYDVKENYTGTYALSTPANFEPGNTALHSAYTRKGKYYLNAGHGGFDSNDRPTEMPLIGEKFYESEGNLDRAFHLEQFIIQNGGQVQMSRRSNTSSDDLALTTIATYSNNYGGYFISLHSNAANASANYHAGFYYGANSTEYVGGSERMAYNNSKQAYQNGCLTEYSYATPRSIADYDFMGWSYGVLKTNTCPGYLVETWFHDYRPEALRFKNSLYNKFLAWQMAVGCFTAPGGTGSLPACIIGDVRDITKSCGYTNYTTRGRDAYLALNDVIVNLYNSSDEKIETVTTGSKSNGVYAFFVPAGEYYVEVVKDGYATQKVAVTATVSKATQYDFDMTEDTGDIIAVQGHYAYDLSMSQDGNIYTLNFKSTGAVDNGYIILTNTSTGISQTVSIGAVVSGSNSAMIDAAQLGDDAVFTWAVALNNPKSTSTKLLFNDSSARNANSSGTYANGGVAIDDDTESDYFGRIYVSSGYGGGVQQYNPDLSKIGNKILSSSFVSSNSSSPYRLATSNGKLYVADWSDGHSGVWVYNPAAGETMTNIFTGTTASTGLISNGSAAVGGSVTGVTFAGTGSARKMYVFCEDYPTGNAGNQVVRYDLGTADTWSAAPSASFSTVSGLLANANVELLATEYGVLCSQVRYSTSNTEDVPSFVHMAADGTVNFNSGQSLTALEGSNGGMALYENTFAVANASGNIDMFSVTWSSGTPSFVKLYTITLSGTSNVMQMDFDPAGNLYIYSKQEGLLVYAIKNAARQTVTKAKSSMTLQGVVLPAVRGHYAYNLSMTETEDAYTLSFNSTGEVASASLVLTDIAANEEITIAIDGVVAGENTVEVLKSSLSVKTLYNWAIVLENPESPSVELLFTDESVHYNNGTYDSRGGVAIDVDTESPYFGTIYTSTGSAYGIQRFNPDFTKNGTPILGSDFGANIHSPYRITTSQGKLYIADHSADKAGVWVYDPQMGESVTNMFVGANDGNGQIVNNSVATGGQATGVTFAGSGASRKMYVFCQDIPTTDAGNKVLRYDVGESDSWAVAPSAQFDAVSALLANANVELVATGYGLLCSQTRYSGNNSSDVPAFVHVATDGTVNFNSSTLLSLDGCNGGGMALQGERFAVVDGSANIVIYKVAWNGSTPSFEYEYVIITPDVTTEINQLAFDVAGNIYAYSRQQGLLVYAPKTAARSTRTDARLSLILEGLESLVGVNEIDADDIMPVYYNLQGIKVDNPVSGFYIVKRGDKITKEYIDR